MAQPTAYNRVYDFDAFQTSNPTTPLPSTQVSAELNAVETTVDAICTNLALIQRDDGAIANASVGIDQLKTEVTFGLETVTDWATSQAYALNAGVWNGSNLYRCIVAHTSGTFSTDLSNSKWTLLVDASTVTTAAAASATTATTKATLATDYAEKTNGAVETGTYSAKAYAIGGTGVTDATGSAKEWAEEAEDNTVAGADTYSAKHHAIKAAASATSASSSASTATTKASEAAASATAAAAASAGVFWKQPCVVASTGNLTLSGNQTIDGVSVSAGSRVLVKDQSSASANGVYVTASGSWSRATPLDSYDEFIGAAVVVSQGSTNADTAWICTVDAGGSLGSTNITWAAFGVGDLKASNNLSDVASAATAFGNLKQAATTSATGVVELATNTEVATGSDTSRAVTPAGAAAQYSAITRAINAQTGTTYTLALTDAGKVLTMTNGSAIVLTIPANSSIALPTGTQIDVVNKGAGIVTMTAASGVTLNGIVAGSGALNAQWAAVSIVKVDTNEWVMLGAHATVA